MDDVGARVAFSFHMAAEQLERFKETLERQLMSNSGEMILGTDWALKPGRLVEFGMQTFPANDGRTIPEPEPCRACLVFQEKKVAQQCPACQMRGEPNP